MNTFNPSDSKTYEVIESSLISHLKTTSQSIGKYHNIKSSTETPEAAITMMENGAFLFFHTAILFTENDKATLNKLHNRISSFLQPWADTINKLWNWEKRLDPYSFLTQRYNDYLAVLKEEFDPIGFWYVSNNPLPDTIISKTIYLFGDFTTYFIATSSVPNLEDVSVTLITDIFKLGEHFILFHNLVMIYTDYFALISKKYHTTDVTTEKKPKPVPGNKKNTIVCVISALTTLILGVCIGICLSSPGKSEPSSVSSKPIEKVDTDSTVSSEEIEAIKKSAEQNILEEAEKQKEEHKNYLAGKYDDTTYVFVSPTGNRYHKNKKCSGMESTNTISISDAKELGYTACLICGP